MITRLTKIGDELALVLGEEARARLGLDADTPVEIEIEGDRLVLRPVRDEQRRRQVETALERANDQYGAMLKRLAN